MLVAWLLQDMLADLGCAVVGPASSVNQALEMIDGGGNLGVGIAGMRERAHQLGGQVKIGSSDRGTTITAILPLKERA